MVNVMELIVNCYVQWTHRSIEGNCNTPVRVEDLPGAARIVCSRMESVGSAIVGDPTSIQMSVFGYLIIGLMSGNNPGTALVMQYHLLEKMAELHGGKLELPLTVSAIDFANAFPTFYQCGESENDRDMWSKILDEQKTDDSKNMVDDIDYWSKLFCVPASNTDETSSTCE